jgi:lipoprotein-anchoring transpeptidase ErfK/SrfK
MRSVRVSLLGVLLGALPLAALGQEVPLAGAPGEGAGDAPAAEANEAGPLRLEVSLSGRELRVIQGSEVLETYPVAVGKSGHSTPQGQFSIRRLVWNPRWVPPRAEWARGKTPKEPGDPNNPMGRVKLFFAEPDYYIHGTIDEQSLGEAASHGCVRMANEDVVELARLVMEHGGEPRPPSWFQRVVNYVRSTKEVRLSNPVSVTVVR